MPRLLESSVESVVDSASTSRIRREDEGPRWEPSRMSMDNLARTTVSYQLRNYRARTLFNSAINVTITTSFHLRKRKIVILVPRSNAATFLPLKYSYAYQQDTSVTREKDRESRRSAERFEAKKKTISKQPLPGFHQAFGSTEIGRFSRSEFFVNMVGESGGNVEVADTESTNVSTDRMSEANGATVTSHDTAVVTTTATTTATRSFDGDDSEEASFDDSNNEIVAPTSVGMYCARPSTPRWHSPHIGAIGSEI